MPKKKIIIAIDGYSSTGKSTLAKALARKLHYIYVDTGAMYRAVTLFAMQHNMVGKEFLDKKTLIDSLPKIQLEFKFNTVTEVSEMFLNGKNVEKRIRSLEVSELVSLVAAIPQVRKKLVELQRAMGKERGLVMDGRDIGTVVFPDAELKIFLTASAKTRATRRYNELLEKGYYVDYDDILKNVLQRDHLDSTREDSPLKKAEDAVEIDNSTLGREEQFELVLKILQAKLMN